jgi:hypothetical protein
MERVVYILGAGFSAPLGVPTVRTFLERARDLYFSNTEKYEHFKKIFEDIQSLARTAVLFKSDLFDLEEVLSILQTEEELEGSNRADAFIRLIRDVVSDSTPPAPGLGSRSYVYGDQPGWPVYLAFVASLFRLRLSPKRTTIPGGPAAPIKEPPVAHQLEENLQTRAPMCYDIVSLNYDCILETAARFYNSHLSFGGQTEPWVSFRRKEGESATIEATTQHRPLLTKLHGCCEMGGIVAPTANKRLAELSDQWKMAYEALQQANHVRIIGYSLPVGDTAVRYLLKSALSKTEHLKTFDVLCWDPDGVVKHRYDSFVSFHKFDFRTGNTTDLLERLRQDDSALQNYHQDLSFGGLEKEHRNYFGRP